MYVRKSKKEKKTWPIVESLLLSDSKMGTPVY